MSIANLVNEKLYHAALLLELQSGLDEGAAFKAQYKALDGAVSSTLKVALDHFIQELAEAVQIQSDGIDLDILKAQLDEEERGLPPIDALVELSLNASSWVCQIDRSYREFLAIDDDFNSSSAMGVNEQLVPLVSMDAEFDLPDCLQSLKDFINTWRVFLAEW